MKEARFRDCLQAELRRRREKNARYSLRAFAAFLGSDHSTLSQILRGSRRIPLRAIRTWGQKLGMRPEELAIYVAAEHVADSSTAERQEQLRHWTAEAIAIISHPEHWHILQLVRQPGFTADSRSIAAKLNMSVDEVNVALSRLLRLRLLELRKEGEWKDLSGAGRNESAFRGIALRRVRQKAVEDRVRFA